MRALLLLALLGACNGLELPALSTAGTHPFANAGTGSSYPLGTMVPLDGSGSFHRDGQIVAYQWTVLQRPSGSAAVPENPFVDNTTFMPDRFGTYYLQLRVSDEAQNADSSSLRIVATGAISSVDAGPDATVPWMGTASLTGSVTTPSDVAARYSWSFASRPPGSVATISNGSTLTPTFVADAAGTYVVTLEARVGDDDVREDTVAIEAVASGLQLGTGIAAYTYVKGADRIVYVHDVGHAEVVMVDPTTGTKSALNIGVFVPRSIASDRMGQVVAVGGIGKVATVLAISQLQLLSLRDAPGCTAKQVIIPFTDRVDCFPADGTIEPISSVYMPTGVVTQVPCPVQFPHVTLGASTWMYMVDGASSQFYLYDASATPPLPVIQSGSLPGITAPVIAAGTNQPYAVTGNGLGINLDATLRFDLNTPVSAGAFSALRYELAVVSGVQVKVFGMETGQPLKLSAGLPHINGMIPTAKLVAYSADEHRLIIVAGTAAGDVVYTVPR